MMIVETFVATLTLCYQKRPDAAIRLALNFAHYIQPETQAAVGVVTVRLRMAPLERIWCSVPLGL